MKTIDVIFRVLISTLLLVTALFFVGGLARFGWVFLRAGWGLADFIYHH